MLQGEQVGLLFEVTAIWFFNALAYGYEDWLPIIVSGTMDPEVRLEEEANRRAWGVSIALAFGGLIGSSVMTFLVVDWMPRLHILRWGLFFLVLVTFILGFTPVERLYLVAVFCEIFHSIVVGILYTITPEVFPTVIRSSYLGIAVGMGHRLGSLLSPFMVAPLLMETSFLTTCIICSGLFVVGLLFAFSVQRETWKIDLTDITQAQQDALEELDSTEDEEAQEEDRITKIRRRRRREEEEKMMEAAAVGEGGGRSSQDFTTMALMTTSDVFSD